MSPTKTLKEARMLLRAIAAGATDVRDHRMIRRNGRAVSQIKGMEGAGRFLNNFAELGRLDGQTTITRLLTDIDQFLTD